MLRFALKALLQVDHLLRHLGLAHSLFAQLLGCPAVRRLFARKIGLSLVQGLPQRLDLCLQCLGVRLLPGDGFLMLLGELGDARIGLLVQAAGQTSDQLLQRFNRGNGCKDGDLPATGTGCVARRRANPHAGARVQAALAGQHLVVV